MSNVITQKTLLDPPVQSQSFIKEIKFIDKLIKDLWELQKANKEELFSIVEKKHEEWDKDIIELTYQIKIDQNTIIEQDRQISELETKMTNWDTTFRLVFAFCAYMVGPYSKVGLMLGTIALGVNDHPDEVKKIVSSESVDKQLKDEIIPTITDKTDFSQVDEVINSTDKEKINFLKNFFNDQKKEVITFDDLTAKHIHLLHIIKVLQDQVWVLEQANSILSTSTTKIKDIAQIFNTLIPKFTKK